MIKKVDHISFAVKDLDKTGKLLEEVYGAEFLMYVVNEEMKYRCNAYTLGGDLIIGLLEPNAPDSFLVSHLDKFGESLQHIGVDVEDLDEAIEKLKASEIKYSGYKEMAGVKREILIGARNSFGSILQLQEWLGDYKDYSSRERMLKAWGK